MGLAALTALWLTASGSSSVVIAIEQTAYDAQGHASATTALSDAIAAGLKADGWELSSAGSADVLLRGTAEVRTLRSAPELRQKGELISVTGSLKMIERGTNAVVAVVPLAGDGIDATVKQVVDAVHAGMAQRQRQAKQSGTELTVRVLGVSYAEVGDIEKALAGAPGVETARAFGDFENETQQFMVTFRGDSKQLAKVIATLVIGNKKLAATAKGALVTAGFRE